MFQLSVLAEVVCLRKPKTHFQFGWSNEDDVKYSNAHIHSITTLYKKNLMQVLITGGIKTTGRIKTDLPQWINLLRLCTEADVCSETDECP